MSGKMYTEEEFFEVWGMGRSEKKILQEMGVAKKYSNHKKNAHKRSIPWEFTLATWWKMWCDSGKWELRGTKKGHYVMGRFQDLGPYSPTNVAIILHSDNSKDVWRTPHGKEKMMNRARVGSPGKKPLKIPNEVVEKIRSEYRKNVKGHTACDLSKKYGVSESYVSALVNNKFRA